MRVMVFFDLPSGTTQEKRSYRLFRKFLLKSGFLMMQESVYCKLVPNSSAADLLVDHLKKNKPPDGLVQMLKVTEKQYAKMEYIVGGEQSEILDSAERLVVL